MKKILSGLAFLILAASLLAACGAPSTPAGQEAAAIQVRLETTPDPVEIGDAELALTISDANGAPIDGAQVDVSADHKDMSGMTMGGAASGHGSGKYVIQANFSMSGNWLVSVYVRKGELDEKLDIPLVVK